MEILNVLHFEGGILFAICFATYFISVVGHPVVGHRPPHLR